jgi:cation diffusion facilitator family transporter
MVEANANDIFEPHNHVFLAPDHEASEKRTWAVIVLCGIMMAAEIVGGLLFGSIALIADGLHMSTHAGALLLAALAYSYARKHASDSRFCFGTGKLGDLAGFTSAIVLAMIAILIGYESVARLFQPVPIHFAEAIPIACLGLAVNIVSAWLLSSGGHHHGHGHGHEHSREHENEDDHEHHPHDHAHADEHGHEDHSHDHAHGHEHDHEHHPHDLAHGREHDHEHHRHDDDHDHGTTPAANEPDDHHHGHPGAHRDNNMRAAIIHVAADAAVSILVIVGLLLARAFGWLWMDPLAGIVGACVIASWSYGLIRDTGAILLDMNPDPHLADQLRQAIEVDGDRLDDLHLWRVGPGHLAAIVSVVTRNPHDPSYYRDRLSRFKILSHLTVEVVPQNAA